MPQEVVHRQGLGAGRLGAGDQEPAPGPVERPCRRLLRGRLPLGVLAEEEFGQLEHRRSHRPGGGLGNDELLGPGVEE